MDLPTAEFNAGVNHKTLRYARCLLKFCYVVVQYLQGSTQPTRIWCLMGFLVEEGKAMEYSRLPGESVLAVTYLEMHRHA